VSDQQPPSNNDPFTPPPPPTPGNPMYPANVLTAKANAAASDAKNALILSIIGLFCLGFILGFLAFRKANEALETIDLYQVAQDKRGIAMTAKILGIIDIIGWIVALLARFMLS
jgi:hypothetical protein